MEPFDLLRAEGLSEKEAGVYLALLSLNEAGASDLAARTGIDRTLIYELCYKLGKRGLVSKTTKGKRTLFIPADPKVLLTSLKKRTEKCEKIMPRFEQLYATPEALMKAEVYSGKRGVLTLMHILIEKKKDYCVIGAGEIFQELFPEHLKEVMRENVKSGVHEYLLNKESERGNLWLNENSHVRFLPDKHVTPTILIICEEVIAIINWKPPFNALLLTDTDTGKAFRNYFDLMWQTAKD